MKLPSAHSLEKLCGCVVSLLLFATGCSTRQTTRFHVAVADIDSPQPEVKFYRVTIAAKASNVKATLHTGFYDADAVRQLYGDVQKTDVKPGPKGTIGTHQFVFDDVTHQWRPMQDSQLFTIVYGADAKAIATQIKMFNESDQTGEQFGRLLAAASGGDVYVESVAAERASAQQRGRVKALSELLKTRKEAVKDGATPTEIGKVLLQAAQDTAKQLGSSVVFGNDVTNGFADAEKFYELLREQTKNK